MPSDIPEITVQAPEGKITIGVMIKAAGLAESTGEANRNIDQGGVKINGEKVTDRRQTVSAGESFVLQVGKRKWAKVTVE